MIILCTICISLVLEVKYKHGGEKFDRSDFLCSQHKVIGNLNKSLVQSGCRQFEQRLLVFVLRKFVAPIRLLLFRLRHRNCGYQKPDSTHLRCYMQNSLLSRWHTTKGKVLHENNIRR